jgi:CBS domain containing-hemolysin-like protein
MAVIPLAVALGILLLLAAVTSMGEAAFLAVNKVRLRHLVQRGSTAAKQVYQLLIQLDLLISTVLVANNVVSVAISVLGTLIFIHVIGPEHGPLVAGAVIATVLLVFCEITPKIFAAAHADRVALLLAWPLFGLVRLLRPLTWLFTRASQGIIRLLGGGKLSRAALVTEEEIKVMIEMGREAGAVTEHELRLLHRIFEFEDALVQDVMIPRDQMVTVEISQKPEDVLDALIEGHSRIPIYRGTLDTIEGVIYANDLLAVWRHGGLFVLADLVRPAYLIPPTKRVAELLRDFQRQKIQIAIVQDKQRTLGLVTLEDLMEEIVGELDEQAPPKRRRGRS